MAICSVEEAVEDIRQGRMIILVDDEDRENEGDITIAAEHVTPEAINFMAKYAHLPSARPQPRRQAGSPAHDAA